MPIFQQFLNWVEQPDTDQSPSSSFLRSLTRTGLIAIKEFLRNKCALRASALTYTLLLSLVPMLAMSTALIKGLGGSDDLKKAVYSYINTLEHTPPIPGLGNDPPPPDDVSGEGEVEKEANSLTAHLRSAADQLFTYVDHTNFAALGSIGVFTMLVSIILVFNNIEMAMNAIWKVKSGRPVLRKVTDYLTLLVLMPLSINLAFAANALLHSPALHSRLEQILPLVWLRFLTLSIVPIFFIGLTLSVIYIFFPNTKVKPIPATIGAFFASVLWFTIQNAYISLQIGVSKYNAIYGSFATVPLFLVWIYLAWNVILAGAEVAFACQNEKGYTLRSTRLTPARQLSCALDIVYIVYDGFRQKEQINMDELNRRCPQYPTALLNSLTDGLVKEKILARTDDRHLLPAAPGQSVQQSAVALAILGQPIGSSRGVTTSSLAIDSINRNLDQSFGEQAEKEKS
ncbi:MAG: YihY/virulence factor BrkB family protein [Thermodesulfobacteriota bacterium]